MKPQFQSLPDQIYNRLLGEIVRGVRPAGAKLSEEVICAELGVSRTPAREALLRLHRDGLVDRQPRRGCFVREFVPEQIADLFECRCWVEALALEQGFNRIDQSALEELEETLSGSLTRNASYKADECLHALIADACPNPVLREFIHQLLVQTTPIRFWRTHVRAPLAEVADERLQIVRAIRSKDKRKAVSLLKQHILNGRKLVLEIAAERAGAGGDSSD